MALGYSYPYDTFTFLIYLALHQGTVTFTITPENKTYSLDLSSPTSTVSEGDAFDSKADLAVTCSEEIMMKMINKEIQPQQAFMKGMLKIKGKMALAMKLTNVLAATRKKLPKAKL
jgi:putative sterol carrier protein